MMFSKQEITSVCEDAVQVLPVLSLRDERVRVLYFAFSLSLSLSLSLSHFLFFFALVIMTLVFLMFVGLVDQ
jgi:hypothetical protein